MQRENPLYGKGATTEMENKHITHLIKNLYAGFNSSWNTGKKCNRLFVKVFWKVSLSNFNRDIVNHLNCSSRLLLKVTLSEKQSCSQACLVNVKFLETTEQTMGWHEAQNIAQRNLFLIPHGLKNLHLIIIETNNRSKDITCIKMSL